MPIQIVHPANHNNEFKIFYKLKLIHSLLLLLFEHIITLFK